MKSFREEAQHERYTRFDNCIGIAISHSRDPKRSDKNNIKINSAFEQITGRTKEELIDSGWAKISYRRYEKLYCQQGGINREN